MHLPYSAPPSRFRKTFASLLILLLFFGAGCGESADEKFHRLWSTGHLAAQNGDYRTALVSFHEILTFRKDSPKILQEIGDCYFHLALYPNALRAYQEALKQAPADQETLLQAARVHLLLHDFQAVEKTLPRLLDQSGEKIMLLRGDLFFLQKKYAEAEKIYSKSLAAFPHSAGARMRLVSTFFAKGNRREAEDCFHPLVVNLPKNPDILLRMARYCLLAEKREVARILLEKLATLGHTDLNILLQTATVWIEAGELDQAVTLLQTVLQRAPENRFAHKLLVESCLQLGRLEEARALLDRAGEADTGGKDLEFLLLKGKYHLLNKEFHTALSQFQTILEQEPKFPLAHYFIALSYLAGGQNKLGEKSLIHTLSLNPDFTDAELTLASLYYKSGNFDLAREHAERIRGREPENFRSYLILGNIDLALRNNAAAEKAFSAAQQLSPELAAPRYYLALTATKEGDIQRAEHLYVELLRDHPLLADATHNYVELLAKQKKFTAASDFLRHMATLSPESVYFRHLLGETLLAANNRQEAMALFQHNISLSPPLKASYLRLFDLHSETPRRLEEILKQATQKQKNFQQAEIQLARLLLKNRKVNEAITQLENAHAAAPRSAEVANNLAWLYVEHRRDDIDEAMRLAQLAYEQAPDNPAFADTLGWVYYYKKMYGRSLWLLEAAYAVEPDNPYTNYHLGALLLATGEREKARKHLTFALKHGVDIPIGTSSPLRH